MPGQAHRKIVMSGVFGPVAEPYEIWSMSVSMGSNKAWQDAGNLTEITQAGSACEGWFGSVGAQMSASAHLTEVAMSLKGPDHKQIGDTFRFPTSVPGGGSAMTHPPQVALRVSLDDGVRGRSHKGGFYLPGPALNIDPATGLISQNFAQTLATSVAGFLESLNTQLDASVCVASKVAGNLAVTRVRIGRALDTIRRRRNAINEAYEAHAVTP